MNAMKTGQIETFGEFPSINNSKSTESFKTGADKMDGQQWIEKFQAMCLFNRCTPTSLTSVMSYYARNLRPNVNECQTKPSKADKLKDFISKNLLFFLFFYRAHAKDCDRVAYMDVMSDLLAMYIDTELKASKRSSEPPANISGRLTSYLYIYLENSPGHLIDTLLKVQFMSSTYHQILDPLIAKVLRIVPEHPDTDEMYVRYFLVYRVWKRINKEQLVKYEINSRAQASLRTSPPPLSDYLTNNVLPKVPKDQKITTRLFLSLKFQLEKACEVFVKHARKSKDIFRLEESIILKPEDNLTDNSQTNNSIKSNPRDDESLNGNLINSSSSMKTVPRKQMKKSGPVVLIDLTSDETSGRVIRLKNQSKNRLSWLRQIGKRKDDCESIKEDSKPVEVHLRELIITDKNETEVLESPVKNKSSEIPGDNEFNEMQIVSTVQADKEIEINSSNEIPRISTEDEEIASSNEKVQMEIDQELEITTTEIEEKKEIEKFDDNISMPTSTNVKHRETVLHINHQLELKKQEIMKKNQISPIKIRDVEFQDNIDGLSLLASVSQRVSDLSTSEPREIIKVKDYNSLVISPDEKISNLPSQVQDGLMEIFPDDDIDRVALNVEVSSSEDASDHCSSTVYQPGGDSILKNFDDSLGTLPAPESNLLNDKDEASVILNGETVFLLQKSPNSNLFIINKAVENHEDEENNLNERNTESNENLEESSNFSYDIYDPRKSGKLKSNNTGDSPRNGEMKKVKKKNSTNLEVKSPRRHRIKQEFDQNLHIPVSTPIYHANYQTSDLYISCRQNCSSVVSCGIPVTHSTPQIHPHSKSSLCACLNCNYGLVTHCSQFIIPPEPQKDAGFFIPLQQTPVIQECPMKSEKIICKLENEGIENETDNNKYQSKFMKTSFNSSLPLKKRFRSLMPSSFEDSNISNIKREKIVDNYPSTPMISIAALTGDSNDDIIKRNFQKDVNGYNFTDERKRKITDGKDGKISRPSKKVKEQQKSPIKNSKRQTRSSQRKVPKVNYCYNDAETEWNPSADSTRKKKKTSR